MHFQPVVLIEDILSGYKTFKRVTRVTEVSAGFNVAVKSPPFGYFVEFACRIPARMCTQDVRMLHGYQFE